MTIEEFKKLSDVEKKNCTVLELKSLVTEVQINNEKVHKELYRTHCGIYSTTLQIMLTATIVLYLFGVITRNPRLLLTSVILVNTALIIRYNIKTKRIYEATARYIALQHDAIRGLYSIISDISKNIKPCE